MAALQFGYGAYLRKYAGAPEIQLLNRFIEAAPANLREKVALLARSGTNLLTFAQADTAFGKIRRLYSKIGMFNNDLFIVSGSNLWRFTASTGELIPITGEVGPGLPKLTWDAGPGYEHLFVSDGELLQYYAGGSHAVGTLTGSVTNQVIGIGGVYYTWNANVDINTPTGGPAHPWVCLLAGDPYANMANMINFIGTPGVDFSTNLRGASTLVTAAALGGPPATSLVVTAISDQDDGNSIATVEHSGSGLTWTGATLSGGGINTLLGVYVPTGEAINALCTLDHYVMASVSNTNKMFFINPGEVVIDTLNFFSKESNPDPIQDLLTAGDTFLAAGSGSIETWYATGDLNAPFAPIEGRTVSRGCLDGSLVLVQDVPMLIGNDGVVYSFGQALTRISDHGIEERIRIQLRQEAGLT